MRWGDPADFPYCPGGVKPCEPRFNVGEFRARLEKQMETLLEGLWTRSEIARRLDVSRLDAERGTRYLIDGGTDASGRAMRTTQCRVN